MRLVVLGSGTCRVGSGRRASGYWLESGAARVRLDCGPGTVQAMTAFGLPWDQITHQFVSHFHPDHVSELAFLLQALKYGRDRPRSTPLALVGPVGLTRLVRAFESAYGTSLLEQEFPVEILELAPGDQFDLDGGGGRLSVAKSLHTNESLAVRIDDGNRAVGYTGDTAPCTELQALFREVDLLVGECSFVEGTGGTNHLDAAGLAALANGSRARRLLATHFYFDPHREALAARLQGLYAGEVSIAEDGMAIAA